MIISIAIFTGFLLHNCVLFGILVQLCMMALSRDTNYTRHLQKNNYLQKQLIRTLLELSLLESKSNFNYIENTLSEFRMEEPEMPWKWYYRWNEDTSFAFPVFKNDSLESYFQSLQNGEDTSLSMNIEWLRLETFSELRNTNVQPIKLARAGFYYTGVADEVQCFSCGIRRRNWRPGENPFIVHRQISPDCRYVNGMEDTNFPISRREERRPQNEDIVSGVNAHDFTRLGPDYGLERSSDVVTAPREHHVDTRGANGVENGFYSDYENLQQENPSFEPLAEATGYTLPPPHSVVSETQEQVNHTIRPGQRNAEPSHDELSRQQVGTTQNGTVENQMNFSTQNSLTGSQTPQNNPNPNPVTDTERQVNGHHGTSENRDSHRLPRRRQNSGASSNSSAVEDALVQKLTPMGVNFDKPKYPAYAVLTVRMSSFIGWKASQTPREMAEAGFAYAGYSDYARCFFCGGGLKNWEEGDDPWVEHARWFPHCAYLRQNKGDTFVRLVHESLEKKNKIENKGNNVGGNSEGRKENGSEDENPEESSASFQSVKQQGYSVDVIKQAIKNLSLHGITHPHSEEILEQIFDMTENNTEGAVGPTTNGYTPTENNETEADEELLKLIKENSRMKRQKMCRICEDEEATIAFLPCSHLVCCRDCADAVRRCPLCGTPVQGTVKTWLV